MTSVCCPEVAELSAWAVTRSVREEVAVRAVIAPVKSPKALTRDRRAETLTFKLLNAVCCVPKLERLALS